MTQKRNLIQFHITFFCIIIMFSFNLHAKQDKLFEKKVIRIGIASMMTPSDTIKYYLKLVEYIGEKTGIPAIMIQRKTYREMNLLLKKNEVDIAFICSGAYVDLKKEAKVSLLAKGVYNGKPYYNALIIVHRDSRIKSLKDLRNKTFAFTDPGSNTGFNYPLAKLISMGIQPENYFKKNIFTYSHSKSIHLVAKKIADAASVDSIVYNYLIGYNKTYKNLTKVIDVSQDFASPPIVASSMVDITIKNKVQEVLLNMQNDKEGKAIMDELHIDKFMEAKEEDYASVEKVYDIIKNRLNQFFFPRNPDKIIKIGLLPNESPKSLLESYTPFIDYLKRETKYDFELAIRKNYEDIIIDLGNGLIDFAFLDALTYLEARKKYGINALLKPLNKDLQPFYYSYILVNKDTTILSLKQLKNHSFAFSSSKSVDGNLIPRLMLANAGIHLKDLSMYKNYNSGESVIKSIIKKDFYSGATSNYLFNKYASNGIKVVAISEPIPTGPLCYNKNVDIQIINKVKEALLKLNYQNSKDREIMNSWNDFIKYGFVQVGENDYESIRIKINNIPKQCGAGCHPHIYY